MKGTREEGEEEKEWMKEGKERREVKNGVVERRTVCQ